MNQKQEIFEKVLALVRNELWGEPLTCAISAEEIEGILKVAKEQAVSGLVANAIVSNQLPIGEDLTLEVCAIQRMHEKKNREMNAEIAQFAGFLNRRNLGYVIMKGQTMAALYPNPLMRSSGDIDFYCPKDDFSRVQQAIEERLGIVMEHNERRIHDSFKMNGISFEMHRRMTILARKKHRNYWNEHIESDRSLFSLTLTINGVDVKTLSPTMNALFIFVHLFRHLTTEGEGLRHFCDWALVLHQEKNRIDVQKLRKHLEEMGLLKAYMALGAWLVQVLGLPKDDFPFELKEDFSKWVSLISKDMIVMGNLGKTDQRKAKKSFNPINKFSFLVAVKQVLKFYYLAPSEVLPRLAKMFLYSVGLRLKVC